MLAEDDGKEILKNMQHTESNKVANVKQCNCNALMFIGHLVL